MKKITHEAIAKFLGVTTSAVTQRINGEKGFYIKEAKGLSEYFGTPIEAWLDIKSYIANHNAKKTPLREVS